MNIKRINSKNKGSSGERELVKELLKYGYKTERTQQYCGNSGEAADLKGLDGIHIECKRYKRVTWKLLEEFIEQAYRDTKDKDLYWPTVFYRQDRDQWMVGWKKHHRYLMVTTLKDWVELYELCENY